MIVSEKHKDALLALRAVLVQLRALAHRGESHEVLAELLVRAEHLPVLIADEADRTAEFRELLAELAQANEAFTFALDRFDEP